MMGNAICEDCGRACGGGLLLSAQWYEDGSASCEPCASSRLRAMHATIPVLCLDDVGSRQFLESASRALANDEDLGEKP
jgi:hypothetical protein